MMRGFYIQNKGQIPFSQTKVQYFSLQWVFSAEKTHWLYFGEEILNVLFGVFEGRLGRSFFGVEDDGLERRAFYIFGEYGSAAAFDFVAVDRSRGGF